MLSGRRSVSSVPSGRVSKASFVGATMMMMMMMMMVVVVVITIVHR